jgi:pSer/pThr/pTyr-binding forkhead associated (FHA) protein
MKAQLLFRDRRSHTQTFSLKAEESILGRDAGIAVAVSKDGVSRHHARILKKGDEYVLEDLRSTNGTFLNGQAVAKDQLRHLDVIGLGKEAELIFVLRPDEAKTIRKVVVLDASLLRDTAGAVPEALPMGEVTLGRSSACNIVATQGPVSKIHCRIVRTQKQVTLEDLGSSNGTFINGERVMTAVLHDGDNLTLGAVEAFKVKVELGEVTSASGVHDLPAPATSTSRPTEARRFSAEWKTRYEWDPSELAELAALQKKLHEEEAARQAPQQAPPPRGKARAPGKAEERPPAKPAPAAAKPAAPKAPTTAKPAVPTPAVAPQAPAKPVEPPVAPSPEPIKAPPPPEARPVAPPPPAAPPPVVPKAPDRPSSGGRIVEVRLRGKDVDVGATETGAHELGRDKGAPLRVNHATVSRQHARIIISDDRGVAYVQDRGGANGTRLNGATIKEIKLLNDGDTVSVGDVELKISIRRE